MSNAHRVHGRNRTTRTGTGERQRRRVTRPQNPPDPPNPGLAYQSLDNDPVYGSEFRYQWTRGSCIDPPTCAKYNVSITTPSWSSDHLVTVSVPGTPLSGMRFHRRIAPQFRKFFEAAKLRGATRNVVNMAGAFFPRTITRNASRLSNHALGTAVDINSVQNPYGGPATPRGSEGSNSELADICADFGIYWGDWYSGTRDPMHFEAVKVLSPTELRAMCQKYGLSYESDFGDPNLPPMPTDVG